MKKFHITSNGKNGFHGAEVRRIANTVELKIWAASWEVAQVHLELILGAFAKRGHKIISEKEGRIGKNNR